MNCSITCCWRLTTLEKWIAAIPWWTSTRRHMFVYLANGICSADTYARVNTLEAHARHAVIALIVRFTLAATSAAHFKGIAFVAGQTEAGARAVGLTTLGVRTAR